VWLSESGIEPPVSVSDYLGNEVFHWTEPKSAKTIESTSHRCSVAVLN